MITAVPTLDELAAKPELAEDLSPQVLAALSLKASAVQNTLAARLLLFAPSAQQTPDHLLEIEEAAKLLRKSRSYLYHHVSEFPFTVRIGGQLRFSHAGIQKWIRMNTGRGNGRTRRKGEAA